MGLSIHSFNSHFSKANVQTNEAGWKTVAGQMSRLMTSDTVILLGSGGDHDEMWHRQECHHHYPVLSNNSDDWSR